MPSTLQRSEPKVFTLDYMRSLRFTLETIGQWPNRTLGDFSRRAILLSIYHKFLVCWFCFTETIAFFYMKKHRETIRFIDMGQIYTNLFLTGLFLQRASLPFQKNYKECVKKFVLEFHLMHHEHISEFATKESRKVNKICKIATKVIYLQLACGMFAYNLSPLVRNYYEGMFASELPANKSFVHSVDYLLPFDAYRSLTGYIIVFTYNWFPTYNIPTAMGIYDLLVFVMVFHMVGHMNILYNSLKEFPRPKEGQSEDPLPSTREYNAEIFQCLKNVIRHYQIIKEFMGDMTAAFDLTLCCYLGFHQIMCCLMLLECSTLEPEALVKYGMLAAVIFQQLIQTSVAFELIKSKSESLGDEVYAVPWEYMDVKNRRILLLFLRNVQDPLGLKACGMVPVGVLTMSTIIRTSFSYYLMLATFAD
uniref:Odorant receptor n=1 Tax=Cydia nigricana TaxID=753170 RepID=A0A223HDB1_9NEOP|nr:putative odorant receptor OR6 [Cydia nigricana]